MLMKSADITKLKGVAHTIEQRFSNMLPQPENPCLWPLKGQGKGGDSDVIPRIGPLLEPIAFFHLPSVVLASRGVWGGP